MLHTDTDGLLRKVIYEKLLNDLKIGKLAPGSRVSLKNLAEELGTSKTPLREALLQLQVEGFVTVLPQRGIMINALTEEEKRDIFEVCAGLDYQAMLSVFPLLTEKHLHLMEAINAQLIEPEKMGSDCNTINDNFHNVYLDLCPNPYLVYLLKINRTRLFLFSERDWGDKFREVNYEEHKVMIELIRSGDARKTATYVRDVHWAFLWS